MTFSKLTASCCCKISKVLYKQQAPVAHIKDKNMFIEPSRFLCISY